MRLSDSPVSRSSSSGIRPGGGPRKADHRAMLDDGVQSLVPSTLLPYIKDLVPIQRQYRTSIRLWLRVQAMPTPAATRATSLPKSKSSRKTWRPRRRWGGQQLPRRMWTTATSSRDSGDRLRLSLVRLPRDLARQPKSLLHELSQLSGQLPRSMTGNVTMKWLRSTST